MAQDPVQLLSQADKAYSSAGSGFSFFGSKTEKFENAAELYIKAGGAYRLQQAGREAGMAYEKVPLPPPLILFSPAPLPSLPFSHSYTVPTSKD